MADGLIEEPSALYGIVCLRENPHQLRKARLGRHIKSLQHADIGKTAPDAVYGVSVPSLCT